MKQFLMCFGVLMFSCWVGCYTSPHFSGLPCSQNDDCLGMTCINGYCGGREVPQTEPGKDASVEKAECVTGRTRLCYDGSADTKDVGECKSGTQTCEAGAWGDCLGSVKPKDELCNGKDDDCDGKIDSTNGSIVSLPCYPEGKIGCVLNKQGTYTCSGICAAGTKICQSGQFSSCQQPKLPSTEECNGKDDNCDGVIDENYPEKDVPCEVARAFGICKPGLKLCKSGKVICQPKMTSTTEACNGKDDDCDGQTDEDFPRRGQACSVSGLKGECARGVWKCKAGMEVCEQVNAPKTETCNGKDDNCDGAIDNLDTPCYTKSSGCTFDAITKKYVCKGECKTGVHVCQNGQPVCMGDKGPASEKCDFLDHNCDGLIDNPADCQTRFLGEVCSRCPTGYRCIKFTSGGPGPYCTASCTFPNYPNTSTHTSTSCPALSALGFTRICLLSGNKDGYCTYICDSSAANPKCPPGFSCQKNWCIRGIPCDYNAMNLCPTGYTCQQNWCVKP